MRAITRLLVSAGDLWVGDEDDAACPCERIEADLLRDDEPVQHTVSLFLRQLAHLVAAVQSKEQ